MKIVPFLIATTLVAGSLYAPCGYSATTEIPKDASLKTKPATIKVLLTKSKKPLLLEAKGGYRVYNPVSEILLSSGVASKRDFVSVKEDGIYWGEKFPNIYRLRLVPSDSHSTILVDGVEYRGCVEIYASQDILHIINEVDVERYLKSILTCKSSGEMDNEVAEAMAIVARTHAYYVASRLPDAFWHVEAQDVGYQGLALNLQNLQIEQAINNTRNISMTYRGGPFAAAWTKDSAGKTADFATIFRKEAQGPHGVFTPFAAKDRQQHHWDLEVPKAKLAKIVGLQKITNIGLYEDKESQKVYALRIQNGDASRTIDFIALQKALGETALKSNDFTVDVKGDTIHFSGYGEGHGVGLCLHSASFLADRGEKAQQILTHFFPDTQLQIGVSPKNEGMIADVTPVSSKH